jgi:hypothetical protein
MLTRGHDGSTVPALGPTVFNGTAVADRSSRLLVPGREGVAE